jgi:hypothetical protein
MIRQFESVGVVFVFLNAARISPTYRLRKREGQALERVSGRGQSVKPQSHRSSSISTLITGRSAPNPSFE